MINALFGLLLLMVPSVYADTILDPEVTTAVSQHQAVFANQAMVVTANPHASKAALAMLEEGGSAVDAAIAAQFVLTLVEPQSSGIGGGAFMLLFDQQQQQLLSFDGRETAPAAAKADRFLAADGTPKRWIDALVGGQSVGVPGVVAMMAKAHQRSGKLPWSRLIEPAIALAEHGFEVSPRLAGLLAKRYNPGLTKLEPAASYFYPGGEPLKNGQLLKNPDLAATLKTIAAEGSQAFYHGKLAEQLVAAVRQAAINPGDLTTADLASYEAKYRAPLCTGYHQYQVCSMAPPSSGGFAVAQLMKLIEQHDMSAFASGDVAAVHQFAQASRLAFADRNRYIGDPDFVKVPIAELLAERYIGKRRALIQPDQDMGKAQAGHVISAPRAAGVSPELPSTSHLSIVDAQGNAVSMTTSIEMAFGSGLMVNGFLLNNQLTDFSFAPTKDGALVSNAVAAGKRPRSSMAPVMVFDKAGKLDMVLGSPGGSRIINYVAQTLIAVLDSKVDIQQAINLPKVTHRNDYLALEKGAWSAQTVSQLQAMGYELQQRDLNSGLHGIQRVEKGWLGGADPRREGLALGLSNSP
ncbi:gamma-glutamyltransferase [Neiella sp. HB171785]|uniref:Glutathione hydrolase proenzyme n=1 Tax=Neiella litorisoli TaxID=2771431 RepID=A0A8J6UQA3_9GAMM|nr:gamma-glutamyltransferase [Neiella litorisoli]MBD1390677.1 gamma-glutamyltransferase [Neiella litorisoli]